MREELLEERAHPLDLVRLEDQVGDGASTLGGGRADLTSDGFADTNDDDEVVTHSPTPAVEVID